MGKKVATESKPKLAVVKVKREPKFDVFTVRIARTIGAHLGEREALFLANLASTASGHGDKFTRKVSKSGRIVFTIGAVAAGRAKLTEAERAARKAARAEVNAAAKNLRKQMRTNPQIAALAVKIANGGKLTDAEVEMLKANVA